MTSTDYIGLMFIAFLIFGAVAGKVSYAVPITLIIVYLAVIIFDYLRSRPKNDDKNNKST